MGDSSQRNRTRTTIQILVSAAAGLVALPFIVVALVVLEHLLFGSRHFSNGLEAVGLTKVLQAIFDALGING